MFQAMVSFTTASVVIPDCTSQYLIGLGFLIAGYKHEFARIDTTHYNALCTNGHFKKLRITTPYQFPLKPYANLDAKHVNEL